MRDWLGIITFLHLQTSRASELISDNYSRNGKDSLKTSILLLFIADKWVGKSIVDA